MLLRRYSIDRVGLFEIIPLYIKSWKNQPGLLLALLVYLCLAFSYFFIVPIFEGPDEWTHTGHVKYIAEGNGLPVMWPGRGIWGGQQPPFYYAVGALLTQPFRFDGLQEFEENGRNPHASIGYALDYGNKNNYLHSPAEDFPYSGLSLTVHILRLYSMFFGLITVVFVYLTAFELFDHSEINQDRLGSPKWFATAVAIFVASQPMFGFITASVANEPANIAFSAVGLWLAQRYVLYGVTTDWRRAAALGVTLGLISLSKMTGLSFGLVAVVAFLQTAIATRKQPGTALLLWRDGLIIGLLFLAVGGWWYWRNYQLYGDFFQQGLYKIYFNVDPQPLSLNDFLYTLSTGEISFWATFGWLNIVAPEWVYALYRIVSRLGLIGIGVYLVRFALSAAPHPSHKAVILHLVFPPALAFSLTRLVAIEGGLQGRQLLPSLGSIAIVIVWGWWMLTPARIRGVVMAVLLMGLVGLAGWLPYGVVSPAYIPRPVLTEAELPADLSRLEFTYKNEIRLIGVEIGADIVQPGERVMITAYWQALKPMERNYSVFVHLVGRDYQTVGQINTYPGFGLYPTSTLKPGQIVADSYPILVEGGSLAPTRLLVNIGLFDFYEPGRPGIAPLASDGGTVSPTVGQLKLIPTKWPLVPESSPIAEFADYITLSGYSVQNCRPAADSCQIIFEWLAQGNPSADYTVFIQLWRGGKQVAGFDAPPLRNDYPTGLWADGELIIDPHDLNLATLPAGKYQILAGLYNPTTGQRLPVFTGGVSVPDYALDLGTVAVE